MFHLLLVSQDVFSFSVPSCASEMHLCFLRMFLAPRLVGILLCSVIFPFSPATFPTAHVARCEQPKKLGIQEIPWELAALTVCTTSAPLHQKPVAVDVQSASAWAGSPQLGYPGSSAYLSQNTVLWA